MEEWRYIPGFIGLYQASNHGRIRSVDHTDSLGRSRKGQVLSQRMHPAGYLYVNLWKDGKRQTHKVHRLVAISFIPNPCNKQEINHIDEDKTNNNVKNLEWCTHKENINHGTCKERISLTLGKKVQQLKNGVVIAEFDSIKDAGLHVGASGSKNSIGRCCLGKQKSSYGYQWRYKEG